MTIAVGDPLHHRFLRQLVARVGHEQILSGVRAPLGVADEWAFEVEAEELRLACGIGLFSNLTGRCNPNPDADPNPNPNPNAGPPPAHHGA